MGLRIGINALFMLPGEVGGREIDTRRLVVDLAGSDRVDVVIVFANRESAGVFEADRAGAGVAGKKIEIVATPLRARSRPARILFEQMRLPALARRVGVDILHSPGYVAPLSYGARSLVTICDLNYRDHPEDFAWLSSKAMARLIPASARRAGGVCTLTEHWRSELIRAFDLAPEKVFVTPCGVGPGFSAPVSAERMAAIRQKHRLPDSFILCPSASHPHKNIERLLEGYAEARRTKDWRHGLVVTGPSGRARSQIDRAVARFGLAGDARFLGWVADAELPGLYAMARALAFPTLYEGFGRPLIEAFAARLPAAVSDIPALREVGGAAALYFDPRDPAGIAEALAQIAGDEALRARLVEAGAARAGRFSSASVVDAHLKAYHAVVA